MNVTKIDYVDVSWNPITGCAPDFDCWDYCWARKFAARHAKNPTNKHPERYEGFRPAFHPERLEEPLRMRQPRRIAVNFMGDMFAAAVPLEWLERVWQTMFAAPWHTYLVLTKRPERMARDWHTLECLGRGIARWAGPPSSHILAGTSIANHADADERIPHLLKCPAAVRWLSIEPMQRTIDLTNRKCLLSYNWLRKVIDPTTMPGRIVQERIDWVVLGGGPFPVHPDWVRAVRDQCQAAGVPFFFKQWGEFRRTGYPALGCGQVCMRADGHQQWTPGHPDYMTFERVGKKTAGRMLDGREWNELPEVVSCR